jgi:hypothetical protein
MPRRLKLLGTTIRRGRVAFSEKKRKFLGSSTPRHAIAYVLSGSAEARRTARCPESSRIAHARARARIETIVRSRRAPSDAPWQLAAARVRHLVRFSAMRDDASGAEKLPPPPPREGTRRNSKCRAPTLPNGSH